MRMTCGRLGCAALVAVLLTPSSGDSQNATPRTLHFTLGTPAELEVDVRYFEPSSLYLLAKDSLVVPIWVSAKNVSDREADLQYDHFTLRVGDAGGLVTLDALPAAAAEDELKKNVQLNPVLKGITRQGDDWGANAMDAVFRSGRLAPGRTSSGWVFFRGRPGLRYTGVLEFGTTRHARELLPTSVVTITTATRGGTWLQEEIRKAINEAVRIGRAILEGERPFGRSYAILFGVSEYAYRNDLTSTEDLKNLTKALTDQGFDKVITLANRQVTRHTLRNIHQHFKDGDALRPDDRLLVYYGGHGDRDRSGKGYILMTDSHPTARSAETDVLMTDFMSWMKEVPVKHLLVLLDACYSGAALLGKTRGGPTLDPANRQELYELSARSGRFVITAGNEEQRAHEGDRGGLFTQAFLRALTTRDIGRPNDRLVTTFELFARTKQFVGDEVRRRGLVPPQAPLLQDLGEAPVAAVARGAQPSDVSLGEFVFVNVP